MNLVLIYLAVMIFFVPIFQLAGMGAVLGYLVAGSLFGPQGLGLLTAHGSQIHLLAELGVIMMLFLIGLELNITRLWQMRGPIFGVGFLQVLLTSLIIFIFTKFLGFSTNTALVIGMILSLSSTAIVLQTLKEKGVFKTTGGQLSFSVLLFQDIAVIPILAILPLLAVTKTSVIAGTMDAGWMQAVKILIQK
jgi:CPA2 family monovalent cation:H+ antiporter-2/glutathione-regulated potassium-efflux system protein KefB